VQILLRRCRVPRRWHGHAWQNRIDRRGLVDGRRRRWCMVKR
jgi:hypothetical protein